MAERAFEADLEAWFADTPPMADAALFASGVTGRLERDWTFRRFLIGGLGLFGGLIGGAQVLDSGLVSRLSSVEVHPGVVRHALAARIADSSLAHTPFVHDTLTRLGELGGGNAETLWMSVAMGGTGRRAARDPRRPGDLMSSHTASDASRLTARKIGARKGKAPIVCLTAYTAPMAAILDEVCDVLLVGDSVGMVLHGLPNTVGVTMEMMILHGQAVMRGSRRALVVVDMPFGSYEGAPEEAYANAVRILKETGAQAVKVESGPEVAAAIAYLTRRGVPVMGHVGLRPQAVLAEGGFRAKGRAPGEGECVIAEALAAEKAGAFAIVVEGVAEDLAARITAQVSVPTIGIGAGSSCDGQILVTEDMLGLFEWTPKFVRRYGALRDEIAAAVRAYARDVGAGAFPAAAETYFAKT